MKTNCNIRDVAELAGVSPGTVSRVLNNRMGKTQVSAATRERIMEAAEKLRYVPNVNARRLFGKRSHTLGLVIPSFTERGSHALEDRHIVGIVNGMESVMTEGKYRLLLLFKDKGFIEEKEYLTLFREKQLDGLLVWGADRDESFWLELSQNGHPHLFLTTCPDGAAGDLVFKMDYVASGHSVLAHLLERGHGKVLWCRPEDGSSLLRDLELGFRQALDERSLTWEETIVPHFCGYGYEDGEQAMAAAVHNVQALLFANTPPAYRAYEYCMEHGVKVPADMALAACDSSSHGHPRFKITRATGSDVLLGEHAARALIGLVEGKVPSVENRIPTELVLGCTT